MGCLAAGVEQWRSDQTVLNTSPEGNLQFQREQARGEFWPSLQYVFEAAADSAQLRRVGFLLECPA
eukprot:3639016-Lingulodinium_polyedra.AAC.1